MIDSLCALEEAITRAVSHAFAFGRVVHDKAPRAHFLSHLTSGSKTAGGVLKRDPAALAEFRTILGVPTAWTSPAAINKMNLTVLMAAMGWHQLSEDQTVASSLLTARIKAHHVILGNISKQKWSYVHPLLAL